MVNDDPLGPDGLTSTAPTFFQGPIHQDIWDVFPDGSVGVFLSRPDDEGITNAHHDESLPYIDDYFNQERQLANLWNWLYTSPRTMLSLGPCALQRTATSSWTYPTTMLVVDTPSRYVQRWRPNRRMRSKRPSSSTLYLMTRRDATA